MLKMFMSDPPYTKTLPELREFLELQVDQNVLEGENGTYKLKG